MSAKIGKKYDMNKISVKKVMVTFTAVTVTAFAGAKEAG